MYKIFNKLNAISIIEIVIVIAIVLTLTLVSVQSYKEYKTSAMYSNLLRLVEQSKVTINNYYLTHRECPASTITIVDYTNSDTTSFWQTIKNNGCIIEIRNSGNNMVLAFKAKITSLDQIQYYCDINSLASEQQNIARTYVSSCVNISIPVGTEL